MCVWLVSIASVICYGGTRQNFYENLMFYDLKMLLLEQAHVIILCLLVYGYERPGYVSWVSPGPKNLASEAMKA